MLNHKHIIAERNDQFNHVGAALSPCCGLGSGWKVVSVNDFNKEWHFEFL